MCILILLSFLSLLLIIPGNAAAENPDSLFRRALILEHANDSTTAPPLLLRAASLGSAEAMNILGMSYIDGSFGRPLSSDSAAYWLRNAVDAGSAKAANNLAVLLFNNFDVPDSIGREKRDSIAVSYLRFAAEEGIPSACAMLADLSLYGSRGVDVDSVAAEKLYLRAAEAGFKGAEEDWIALASTQWHALSPWQALSLAIDYASRGLSRSSVLLASRALSGDLPSHFRARANALIAFAKSNGKGTPYDYEGAIDGFYRAAVEGNPSAAFFLAESLEMFPDLLKSRNPYLTPDILRDIAAKGGVRDALSARKALFLPLSSL